MANIKELIQSIESGDSSFDEKLAAINQMEETLVAMREHEQEVIDENVELIIEALRTIEAKVEAKLRIIPEKGEQGLQGPKGEQGDRGLDGANGRDGRDGKDGRDGVDGQDGVGVTDAKIDFDGSLVITLSDGREINVGEVVPVDVAEKIRTVHNIQSGSGGDSQTVLDAIAALQATIATYGTMATQNANNVAITGGTINNTTVGATTPSTGVFTTLTAQNETLVGTGQNLLTYSSDFSNAAWGSSASNVTRATTTINFTNASSYAYNALNPAVAGLTYTFSVTLSSTNKTAIAIRIAGTATGSGGQSLITLTATPTRYSVTAVLPAGNTAVFAGFENRTGLGGDGSLGSITVSNAQLEIGSTANTYIPTTTTAVYGTPTLSFSGVASIGLQSDGSLYETSAGTGNVRFYTNNIGQEQARVSHTASAVNYVQVTGGATTKGVIQSAQGSDSNISYVTQSKGTGAIDLAAGSSGVNISNGGTVTAITRTATGTGYTTIPSVAISAPTTAGGVNATVAIASMTANTGATVSSGGTGYTIGDVLSVVGGTTATVPLTITVTAVSGGVITTASTNNAAYSVLPTNPVSVTGGTGTGATFNLTWIVSTFTITNAGSGYVEQPTVTFSGGGGSGAAAYATVGSTTVVRTLGPAMDFYTPAGTGFRVGDAGATSTYYWQAIGGAFNGILRGGGSTQNALIQSGGTGGISLQTNNGAQTQFIAAHTASAVNYVQVTGAATGSFPTISAEGSDATTGLIFLSKGSSGLVFRTRGGGTPRNAFVMVDNGASSVNYLTSSSNVASSAPSLSATGTDTNIPLVLQPKGTGALQAQQTDSTATGGNARGANAVDWQTGRSIAAQVASGSSSGILGGFSNSATGQNSFVLGGAYNTSSGYSAVVAGGYANQGASNFFTGILSGYGNSAAGYLNIVVGGYSNSGTSASAVTTQSATMNGTTAVTLSGSNANIKVGQLVTGTSISNFPNTYVAAISGTSLTLSQAASGSSTSTLSFFTPHGVVVGGGNNQATGSYSFIGGGGDAGTAANRNVASGDWSVVCGGHKNTASGVASFVGGGGIAPPFGSFPNTATQTGASVVGGFQNTASNQGAFIGGGYANTANGVYSAILGGVGGTARSISGNHVFPACDNPFNGNGTSQTAMLVLARQTTDATPTVLTSVNAAAGTVNQVILPNNSAYYFRGEVVSGVTGGGNTKGWYIEGVIKRGANAASTALVGTPTVTSSYADAGASTWTIAVTADTTNGGLAVTFTGQAATTIRTVCQIRTTEMTY